MILDEPRNIVVKRIIALIAILVLFLSCYFIMANKYDPLARYPYTTKENRDIILQYMDNDDIDYIISQKIKPAQFMDFITLDDFETKNILYYDIAKNKQPTDANYIILFMNTYRSNYSLNSWGNYLTYYSYDTLISFFNNEYKYKKDTKLISNPDDILTVIDDNETVFNYVPKDLISVDADLIPFASNINGINNIYIKSELETPLRQMCSAIQSSNSKTCGGLILTGGYVSYENQIDIYEDAIVKYGVDNFEKYSDYPGQSERQLGYTITLTISESDNIDDSEQVKWLKENSYKYGFIIRYPEGKEIITNKTYQPLTLRYVGVDKAEELHKENATLEE